MFVAAANDAPSKWCENYTKLSYEYLSLILAFPAKCLMDLDSLPDLYYDA